MADPRDTGPDRSAAAPTGRVPRTEIEPTLLMAKVTAEETARLRVPALVWLVPAAVTAIVGGLGTGRPSLWTDELRTAGMAAAPWPQFRHGVCRRVERVPQGARLLNPLEVRSWVSAPASS